MNDRLEEWCDGKCENRSVKTLRLNRVSRTVHDGEEMIPVLAKDVKRVFKFRVAETFEL